jgi:Cdc6-like AAA superfamily ATPase|tara:strand:- start:993 stop:1466 length:474 start_codon:yes stop_codon:yes gene_type:complete
MTYMTSDVFGVKSTLIKSYIERDAVDEKFKAALEDGNEVIVYGSSKQGKTSLILRHLAEGEYVKIECSPQTQPIDIYKSILRQLNIAYIESESSESASEFGGKVSAGFKIKIPFFGDTDASAEIHDKDSTKQGETARYIEYNFALAQDISELLKSPM